MQFRMGGSKRIALVAHDNLKDDLVGWCVKNVELLKDHQLCGTGTTARLVSEATGLMIERLISGPLGGDQQIGARIAEGNLDMLFFFSDPLETQPHDPDIKALLRIACVYDIPVANNRSTADFLINSSFMNQEYVHEMLDYSKLKRK
jgi:methylglyoxal synthase